MLSGDGFDNEVCYTGQIYDERTGLYYYNARFYDASAGAFTSQDTYRGEGSDPRTLNLYGYCGGDPVNLTDPTGHWWLAKAWKGLKSKVKKSKVYRGAKKIKKKAKKVYHKAKKKVQRAKRAVKKKAKKIIRKAKKKLRRAKNQVVTRFRSGKKKVSEAVRNGKTKIKDAARSAAEKAKRGAAAAIKRGNDALTSKKGKGALKVASHGANAASATIDIAGNAINDRESGATWEKTVQNAYINGMFTAGSYLAGVGASALFFYGATAFFGILAITSPAGWIALGSVAIGIYVSMRFSKQMNRGGNRSIKSRVEEFMLR